MRTPICGYIVFLVVFGTVSRVLEISCNSFGIYRYQYREYVRDSSTPILFDILHDMDTVRKRFIEMLAGKGYSEGQKWDWMKDLDEDLEVFRIKFDG